MSEDPERSRRQNPTVWLVRIATVGMLLFAVVVAARKWRTPPGQDELMRFAELTVPAYLDEVAQAEARLDRLFSAPVPSAEEARALLVDEVMPLLIRAKKHASQVVAESPAVKES